jgi:hypothetical protein
MSTYYCECCNYYAKQKSNYVKHLTTKKHINMSLKNSKIKVGHNIEDKDNNIYNCVYCDKIFKHRSSLSRHLRGSCKHNKKENYQELADLMNEKDQIIEKNMKLIDKNNNELEVYKQIIHKLEKQIDKISNKLQIKNINNGNLIIGNQTFNTINLQLLSFNHTDYNFLTDKDYINCFDEKNHCVKSLIEKVHFNKHKPENMNIYISSIKGKFIMVYRDNKWQVKTRKEQIDDLYECNELMLENWYDEYHEKYPHIIKSFKKYLQNKENDDEFISNIKDEILLMLYNKRDLIINNESTIEL